MSTNNNNNQHFSGACHCGGIKFEFNTNQSELTTCDCSICKMKNALMIKVHEDSFDLIQGDALLTEYQFHTNTARHFFCKVCGIYPFHRKRVTPDYFGINVNCLTNIDLSKFTVRETNGSQMD